MQIREKSHRLPPIWQGIQALLQDGVNDRVDVLIKVLKQERESILDGQLQLLEEVAVIEGLHLAIEVLALSGLDPVYGLHLRIDAQRISPSSHCQDAVLD